MDILLESKGNALIPCHQTCDLSLVWNDSNRQKLVKELAAENLKILWEISRLTRTWQTAAGVITRAGCTPKTNVVLTTYFCIQKQAHMESLVVWSDQKQAHMESLVVWSDQKQAHMESLVVWSDQKQVHMESLVVWSDQKQAHMESLVVWSDQKQAHMESLVMWSDQKKSYTTQHLPINKLRMLLLLSYRDYDTVPTGSLEKHNDSTILIRCTLHLLLFCAIPNKCTIISQIITLLHVTTLSYHLQTACNQYLAKLHKHFKCSCW